jgi:hypothetical protein
MITYLIYWYNPYILKVQKIEPESRKMIRQGVRSNKTDAGKTFLAVHYFELSYQSGSFLRCKSIVYHLEIEYVSDFYV